MKANFIWASTLHRRFSPVKNEFKYDVPYLLTPINELESISGSNRLFSLNGFNLFSLYYADYLQPGRETLDEKLLVIRNTLGLEAPFETWLLTFPRFLGKVFNPISLYFSVNKDQQIEAAIVEVTNTYGEKHVYAVQGGTGETYIECVKPKEFHVSPFLSNQGEYFFRIGRNLKNIEIHIRYSQNNRAVLYANLTQKESFLMTDQSMLSTAFKYPLGIIGTMPRILKEAAKLAYLKKIPAAGKPIPTHPHTIKHLPPTRTELVFMALVNRVLKKMEVGQLEITLPDGATHTWGKGGEIKAKIKVREYAFFKQLVLKGEMGFGESYVEGVWETEDIVSVLTLFIRNKSTISSDVLGNPILRAFSSLGHFLRRNTVTNSRANIQAHYDLSNEMYALFLDEGMNYSSAYFESKDDSLEVAQIHKLDRLIDGLHIQPHHHVLEIGSGWGSAAIRMAQKKGCRVTTLTLSKAQYDKVLERVKSLDLQDRVTVLLQDYRHHLGTYDRILSIEMIEAVGHEFLPKYFKTLESLLKPQGILALQAITVPDQRYDSYRSRVDWIQKYIFPGGHLPSLSVIQTILLKHTNLMINSLENIGPHYAKTLAHWRLRFLNNESKVRQLGFDTSFIRKWVYYLCYCEAGFSNRYINTLQIFLSRPINLDLIKEDQQ